MNKFDNEEIMNQCISRMETKRFVFGKKYQDLDVYNIPLELLSYNKNNGRIFLGINEKEKQGIEFSELSLEDYNDEIENLIWGYDEQKNLATMSSIKEVEQLEVALISSDGIVIDGNRRFTCLRRLNRTFPEDNKYKYLKAAIVRINGNVTAKDIKRYELNVQFGKEQQADYHLTDKVMSIYREIQSGSLSRDEVQEEMNVSRSKVNDFIITAEQIMDFLVYYNIPDEYYVIDKNAFVGPLEVLAKYLNSPQVTNNLSESEKSSKTGVFYDLLVGAKLSLPTQELRDGLIRDIYKKNPEICTEFLSEYNTKYSQRTFDFRSTYSSFSDFDEFRTSFLNSELSADILLIFQTYKDRANRENTLYGQLNLAKKALENIKSIDINLFRSVSKPDVQKVYNKVKEILMNSVNEINNIFENEYIEES